MQVETATGSRFGSSGAKTGLSDKDLKMASVERIHWIQPRGGKKKRKPAKVCLKTTHKEAESDAQSSKSDENQWTQKWPVAQGKLRFELETLATLQVSKLRTLRQGRSRITSSYIW